MSIPLPTLAIDMDGVCWHEKHTCILVARWSSPISFPPLHNILVFVTKLFVTWQSHSKRCERFLPKLASCSLLLAIQPTHCQQAPFFPDTQRCDGRHQSSASSASCAVSTSCAKPVHRLTMSEHSIPTPDQSVSEGHAAHSLWQAHAKARQKCYSMLSLITDHQRRLCEAPAVHTAQGGSILVL